MHALARWCLRHEHGLTVAAVWVLILGMIAGTIMLFHLPGGAVRP